jgi:type II secretory pathway pseudopilin PulG
MNQKIKIKKNNLSFTLIETLVAISIFSLMIILINNFIVSSYRTHGYVKEEAQAVDEARRGIEIMTKEIREAKPADNGSYTIERADDKQFVFYSDIDDDGKTERVRYFLGTINSGSQVQDCTSTVSGGSCSVTFSNLLAGDLKSAQVRISTDGDLDSSNEYVTVRADGATLGRLCVTGCLHCAGVWQGATTTNIDAFLNDNSVTFLAQTPSQVGKECPPPPTTAVFSMKSRFELSWSEEVIGLGNQLKKGVTKPVGNPVSYPQDQEQISIITSYVRNNPPIFKYYDENGNELTQSSARLENTKLMKTFLVINVDPNRPPNEFQLESYVQLRNLKTE